MAIAEFAQWVNPVLQALQELGGSARPQEVVDRVARNCKVPDSVLDQTITGGVSRFANQVHWARFYLAEAGYIDRSRRGVWKLADGAPGTIPLSDVALRELVTEVQDASRVGRTVGPRRRSAAPPTPERLPAPGFLASDSDTVAPSEDVADHSSRLLATLKTLPPAGFERLCQRLLREAGFEEVVVTGRSGDGGIDGNGVLSLNAFVSFRVLFQCKRYDGSVGPGHVRDFRGAMQGRADKGIILTTGSFSADARREAVRDGVPPIELVDGERLIHLFEELELGLIPRAAFEVDDHFFDEYRR